MEYISCMRLIFKHICWMIAECSLGKNSWASATIVKIMPTVISCYEYFILDGMRRIESWFWQLNKCEHVLTLNSQHFHQTPIFLLFKHKPQIASRKKCSCHRDLIQTFLHVFRSIEKALQMTLNYTGWTSYTECGRNNSMMSLFNNFFKSSKRFMTIFARRDYLFSCLVVNASIALSRTILLIILV